MGYFCKIFGHKWKGVITGVTYESHPIGRCSRCDIPIVDNTQKVATYMHMCYKAGRDSDSVEDAYQEVLKKSEDK